MSEPDPKRPPRIRDAAVMKRMHLRRGRCRACGARGESLHHLVKRSQGGDDVVANLIFLCGDGTRGCHGALHGSPYLHGPHGFPERRDSEWVRRRIGERLTPEELMYVGEKMGAEAGAEWLHRHYYLSEET